MNIFDGILELFGSLKLSEPNENVFRDIVTDNIFWLSIKPHYSFVIGSGSIRVLNGVSIFHNLPQFYVDGLKSDFHSLFLVDIVISIEDSKPFRVRGSTCIRHTQNSKVVRPLINREGVPALIPIVRTESISTRGGGEWEIQKFFGMY